MQQGLQRASEVLRAGGATCIRLLHNKLIWQESAAETSQPAEEEPDFEDFLESMEDTVLHPGPACAFLSAACILCDTHLPKLNTPTAGACPADAEANIESAEKALPHLLCQDLCCCFDTAAFSC